MVAYYSRRHASNSVQSWKNLKALVIPSFITIYSLSDLGVSNNLIGSLSRSNWASFIDPYHAAAILDLHQD